MTFMVGIGPFVVIPFVIQAMHGPLSLVAWAAGALLAAFDGCIWAELGAAMPQAGGSYVYLREAYGPGRWGRLMSFLYIWQTIFQGPLSIASGALGFANYSAYLTAKSSRVAAFLKTFGTHAPNAIAVVVIVLIVLLLYRRITQIGKISVVFSVVVIGTILWIIWGGATHFDAHRVFDFSGAPLNFSWLLLVGLGHGIGADDLQLSRLLQRLQPGRRDEKSGAEHSARDFHFDSGHHGALSGDADEHPERDSVARGANVEFHREHVHRARVRQPLGHACDGADSAHGAGIGVFGDAGIFARAICCGA